MTQILKSSLQEINEIVLVTARYSMTIPSSTLEQVESIPHDYKKPPFFTYELSFDNITFFPQPNGQIGDDNAKYLAIYTDNANIYFHYFYAGSPTPSTSVTYYIKYKLFLTEANK